MYVGETVTLNYYDVADVIKDPILCGLIYDKIENYGNGVATFTATRRGEVLIDWQSESDDFYTHSFLVSCDITVI